MNYIYGIVETTVLTKQPDDETVRVRQSMFSNYDDAINYISSIIDEAKRYGCNEYYFDRALGHAGIFGDVISKKYYIQMYQLD